MPSVSGSQGGQRNYDDLFNPDLKTGEGSFSKTTDATNKKFNFSKLRNEQENGKHKLHHFMSRMLTPITAIVERLTRNNKEFFIRTSDDNSAHSRQWKDLKKSINDYTNNLRDVSKQIKEKLNEIKKIEMQIEYGSSSWEQIAVLGMPVVADPKVLSEQLQEAKNDLAKITQEWVQVRPNVDDLKSYLSNSAFSGSTLLVKLNRAERKIDQTLLNQSVQQVNSFLNREAVTEVRGLLKKMPAYDPQDNSWTQAIDASVKKIVQAEAAYKSVNGADNKTEPTPETGKLKTADDVIMQKKHLVNQLKLYPFGIYQLKEKTQEGKYDSNVIKTNMSYVRNVVQACLLQPPGDPFAKEVAARVLNDLKDIRINLHAELAGSATRPANQGANNFFVEVNQWIDDLNNDVINGSLS